MRLFKLLFSISGIFFILFQSSQILDREEKVRDLMKGKEVIEASVLKVHCNARRKSLIFSLEGKKMTKRIYTNREECLKLADIGKIQLKIDKDRNIVFAEEQYNDSSENESIATILITISFIFVIFKYSIMPTLTELRDGKI